MAIYPCDYCGERYVGPQTTFYPSFLHGTRAIREKRRACPVCANRVLDTLHDPMHTVETPGFSDRCDWCGYELERVLIFCTAYFPRQEREDYWAIACPECVDERAGMALFGPVRPKNADAGYWAYLAPPLD